MIFKFEVLRLKIRLKYVKNKIDKQKETDGAVTVKC